MFKHPVIKWSALCIIILAIILIPFILFESKIETWFDAFVQTSANNPGWVALVLTLLLACDILIPTPSSLVSTAGGFLLSFTGGLITSSIGMTLSCIIGFWVGVKFGRPMASRLVGDDELAQLETLSQRFGDWVLVISRPVPVLAEASVMFAGISNMPLQRYLLLSTLSNIGVSAVYAAVGAFSATANSFLLAFGGAILVPMIAMIIMNKVQKKPSADRG